MGSDETSSKRSNRGRGRGSSGSRSKGRGRGRGRSKKSSRAITSDEEDDVDSPEVEKDSDEPKEVASKRTGSESMKKPSTTSAASTPMTTAAAKKELEEIPPPAGPIVIDMEADISQLEAPTFTTISRGPPEPMLRLNWDHKVNLIGEKVLNPMIYCCDQCNKPILIYGRMIPCKHVFCLRCARAENVKSCPRCNERAVRVEQTGLGTIFMCTHGGTRYGNTGCRRTYLSQRDLQAHINHRHVSNPPPPVTQPVTAATVQTINPIEPSALSQKTLAEKAMMIGSMQSRKHASESLNSPRPSMTRGGPSHAGASGPDNYYNYGGHPYSSSANPAQMLHNVPLGLQQSSHYRSNYPGYGLLSSSPQTQPPSSASSPWSQSSNQYYR